MSKQSVFCIATTEIQAEDIVSQLKNEGFSNDDISVLFPDKTGTKDFLLRSPEPPIPHHSLWIFTTSQVDYSVLSSRPSLSKSLRLARGVMRFAACATS